MKNSWVKNVALVDNYLQGQQWISNHARTGFGIWKQLPEPTIHYWISDNNFDFFKGSHNGFDTLNVSYTRSILFYKPFCWIVIDEFNGKQPHSYQQIWQGRYTIDDQYNKAISVNQNSRLYPLQADPTRMNIGNRKNFWTESVVFEKLGVLDYAFITLIDPCRIESEIIPDIRLFERMSYKQVLIFNGNYKHALYFKKLDEISLDEIQTDAEMVAVSYQSDSLYVVLMLNGSRLDMSKLSLKLEKPGTVELQRLIDGTWDLELLQGQKQSVILNEIEVEGF